MRPVALHAAGTARLSFWFPGTRCPGPDPKWRLVMVRPPLSAILSFNGGYVDTMGFLALTVHLVADKQPAT